MFQIIVSAEQHEDVEDLPFRAIYAAYETILAQHGMDPNHDRVYLRFLFRLGKKKLPTQSLFESFESLLEELGIELEFTTGEDGIEDITRNFDTEKRADPETDIQSSQPKTPPKPTRRASFHSYTETPKSGATRARARSRDSSFQSPRLSPIPSHRGRPATRAGTRSSERTHWQPQAPRPPAILSGRGGLTTQDYASRLRDLEEKNRSLTRLGNFEEITGPNGTLKILPTELHTVNTNEGSMIILQSPEQSDNQPTNTSAQLPFVLDQRERLYRPSETQLLRDAETFQHYRCNALARDIIRKWCSTALQAENDHKRMEFAAINYDTSILLHQAFEQWQLKFHGRRQIAERKKLLANLEHQTRRRRDLFLLVKAFTHWAQRTHDEVLRTSVSRRHILSLRYFNAWRKVTAVNERKLRHPALRKFYRIWKRRCTETQTVEVNAACIYEDNLLKNIYWRWFWTLCEKKAPQWRAAQLKAKYFYLWVERVRQIEQREFQLSNRLNERTKQIVFTQWLKKTRLAISCSQIAVASNERRLTARSLLEWKLGWLHAPISRELSNMVDWRIASTAFATLVKRCRSERQAESVDRLRIIRNGWTRWNDRLRWQAVAQQIGDRFMHESLYKWVIAARFSQQHRLHERRLKRRALLQIMRRIADVRAQSQNSCQVILLERNHKALKFTFEAWTRRLGASRQNDQKALEFYTPRITYEALQLWQTRSDHIQKLNSWVKKSEFYFLATKFLKRWRTALISLKRKKRRGAYAKLRRKLKMDLASEVISRWRSLTIQVLKVDKEAQLIYQNRLLQFGGGLIEIWRTRWLDIVGQNKTANSFYLRKVAERYLRIWHGKLWFQHELEEEAERYAELQTRRYAVGWLRKIRVQMIELQGHPQKAISLRELYEKRYVQNLLKRWRSKTAIKRGYPQPDMTLSARSTRFTLRTEEDIVSRAENWTDFEEGLDLGDPEFTSTPMPSHLTSPSKRLTISKAFAKGSTTPLGTPLQLRPRAQPKTGPRVWRKGRLGTSTAFRAIIENEPKTPNHVLHFDNEKEVG